jgi:NADPH-dependent 7-cyano-7-deazaguanine reductase QueF-like protein
LLKQYQREWEEDKKTFRDKPRHDFTSHCADAFRMMAISWKELKPEPKETIATFPIKAHNGRIITAKLDDLWDNTPKRRERY